MIDAHSCLLVGVTRRIGHGECDVLRWVRGIADDDVISRIYVRGSRDYQICIGIIFDCSHAYISDVGYAAHYVNCDRGRIRAPHAVADVVGEGVHAGIAGVGGIVDGVIRLNYCRAVRWVGDAGYTQRIAVIIAVIVQHIDVDRNILTRQGGVINCNRRGVVSVARQYSI
ncbi:hypothetical protein ES708_21036 [subsurface metagenome]